MKKIFFMALSITILLSTITFISCSEKEDTSMEKTAEGKIILRFWHAFSDAKRSEWIQTQADTWNESQDTYFMIPESKGNYRETLNATILAVKQGQPPQLAQIFEVGSQIANDSQIFQPVGEIGNIDYSDYIDSVLNYYTINGKVNSIPFNSSSPVLYYNKDKMKEAGLDPEMPPKTLEEVIEFTSKAKDAGVKGAAFSMNLHGWFYEQLVAEQGGLLANNDNGRTARATTVYLNSKEMKRVVNLMKELNDKGLYSYTGKLEDWGGSDSIFIEGQAMFHVTSTADLGNLSQSVEGSFELGTGFLPIPKGPRNGTIIGGASVWLVKGFDIEVATAAQNFLLYMTNTKNMADWHKLTGYYPVRKSSIDLLEQEGWFSGNPERTVAFTQLLETESNTATAGALIGSFSDTRTILAEAIQKVFNGAVVDEALEEANEKANIKLQEYNQNIQ